MKNKMANIAFYILTERAAGMVGVQLPAAMKTQIC